MSKRKIDEATLEKISGGGSGFEEPPSKSNPDPGGPGADCPECGEPPQTLGENDDELFNPFEDSPTPH